MTDSTFIKSSDQGVSVGVIGAGIIGMMCADELSRRGANVHLYDTATPGRGASWVAAGMLAPAFEAAAEPGEHPRLFDMCRESARQWHEVATRLETEAEMSVGYSAGPSIAVAADEAQEEKLTNIAAVLAERCVPHHVLTKDALLSAEPAVGHGCRMGLLLSSDGQVDNRRVVAALLTVFSKRQNIRLVTNTRISDPNALLLRHDAVVCTAGWQSPALEPVLSSVRPVGGQLLILDKPEGAPHQSLRAGHVYVVPKSDRIVVGASVEPGRTSLDTTNTVLKDLLKAAREICPILEGAEMREAWAGIRPTTLDHGPVIGKLGSAPLYAATGHYRNGILLAPITARSVADMVLNNHVPDLIDAFRPGRFVAQGV